MEMVKQGPDASLIVQNGVIFGADSPASRRFHVSKRRHNSIPLTLFLGLLAAGSYVGYQRIGTTANASLVETTTNWAGGFLAIGMADHQPGFVLLSALDKDKVDIQADQVANQLAGTHTIVHVNTPSARKFQTRLRGPQVILVDENGNVEAQPVDWSLEDFMLLQQAADCSTHEAVSKNHHLCGAPFADLHEALAGWPKQRVPAPVRAFLAPYANLARK